MAPIDSLKLIGDFRLKTELQTGHAPYSRYLGNLLPTNLQQLRIHYLYYQVNTLNLCDIHICNRSIVINPGYTASSRFFDIRYLFQAIILQKPVENLMAAGIAL